MGHDDSPRSESLDEVIDVGFTPEDIVFLFYFIFHKSWLFSQCDSFCSRFNFLTP